MPVAGMEMKRGSCERSIRGIGKPSWESNTHGIEKRSRKPTAEA